MEDIPREKLLKAGKYLDDKPRQLSNASCKDEYWRKFIDALPQRIYTNAQIEEFAEELFSPTGSPGLKLLVDLTQRGLEYEEFLDCLLKVECYKAHNLFVQSTVPVIKQQPVGQPLSRGDTLVLTCIADCSPPPTYQWYWEDNLIPNVHFPQLKVENVQSNVTGRYRCKVTNKQIADSKHNYIWSDTVQVEIVKHPVQASDGHVDQYMSSVPSSLMTTSSSSSGSFPPISLNSGPLSSIDSRSLSSLRSRSGNSRKDQTDGDTPIDQSTSMTSLSSMSSSSMTPSVSDSDSDIKLTKPLTTDMKFKYNESVIMECQAKSMSGKELTFTWFKKKGGTPQKLHLEHSMYSSTLNMSPSARHTTIDIWCEITHADNATSEKVVTNRAKVKIVTVWITEQPKDIVGVVGEQAVLSCKAEGKGKIHYYLLKMDPDPKTKTSNFTGQFPLSLEEGAWGKYKLQAANEDHFEESNEFKVVYKPKNWKPLSITEQPLSVVCERGKDVTLTCKAEPVYGTQYQWYFNDSPMIGQLKNELSLTIYNDQFGQYHCTIKNKGESVTTNKVSIYPKNFQTDQIQSKNSTQKNQLLAEQAFITEDDEALGFKKVAYATEKVALLIGNQNYLYMDKLTSPHSDVLQLKETLTKMDFKVFAYFDLSYTEMKNALQRVCSLLGPGVYLFFYYSGHGFHLKLRSYDYIMPVDATKDPVKCPECFSVPFIVKTFQETLCKAFVFFDSCRSSYTKPDQVVGPKNDPSDTVSYTNILRVSSCSANRSAYEKVSTSCSVFNTALCKGLQQKLDIIRLGPFIIEEMYRHNQTKHGLEFQRPDIVNNMRPSNITLHEEIMRESWATPPFDAKEYANMYKAPNDITLTLTGFAEAKVTFVFLSLNCLKITSTPINEGQCREMVTMVYLVMTQEEENMTNDEKPSVKSSKETQNDLFYVSGIQKCKQLKLKVEFHVKAQNSTLCDTCQIVQVELHPMVNLE